MATSTGGAAAPSGTPTTTTTPATPVKPVALGDPVPARKPNIAYKGPVYQMTATGQMVPYVPPVPAGATNSVTGGSPV